MERIKIRPSDFVQKILYLNGEPFSLRGREYLKKIYDGDMQAFLLRTGRQVEKSTTLAGHMLSRVLLIPFFQALYVSPSSEQTRTFSSQKLQPFIKYSPVIQQYYVDNKLVNRVYEKEFKNGSRIMLAYAFLTADRIRGKSADAVYIDEVQDILADNLPVIEETLSHSKYRYRLYAGTPKHRQSLIESLWNRSTQTEWIVKCDACGHWNVLGEQNVTKEGLVCEKCKKPLNPKNGVWVDAYPDAEIKGMRISQLIVPWIKWEDIWLKYTTYPRAKFYNEVLGLPYDDATMALQLADLERAAAPYDMLTRYDSSLYFNMPLYMGIDWATSSPDTGSYTAVVIGGFRGEKFLVAYMRKFIGAESDISYIIDEIVKLVKTFRVSVIGADWGVGSGGANAELRRRLGKLDKVWEYYYSANQRELVKWDKKGYKFILSRTEALSTIFMQLKNSNILVPKLSSWRDYVEDFLNIYMDYNSRTGRIFYNKTPGKSDDLVHALLYAYFTAMIDRGKLTPAVSKMPE